MTSALEISPQVFVPATFEERPGLYAFVTNLTNSRKVQRPVALFYETDGHSWSLIPPANFLSTLQQRHQLDLQQQSKAQSLLQADYQELTGQYDIIHSKLAAQLLKHASLAEKCSRLEDAAHAAEQASQQTADQHAQLNAEIEAEKTKAAAATKKMTNQGQGLIDALWTAAGLRKEVAAKDAHILDLNHEIAALHSEACAATHAKRAASTALQDMRTSHEQLRLAHKQQLQEADEIAADLEQLHRQLDASQKELKDSQFECSSAAERANAAKQAAASLQKDQDSLYSQLELSQAGLDSLQMRQQEQDQQLTQANATISNMHEAAQNLRCQLSDAHQHIHWQRETHESSLQGLQRDIAGLQHERDWFMHEKSRHLQQQEQHHTSEMHQLQSYCEQLQRQQQELQEDFAFSLHQIDDLTAKLDSSAKAAHHEPAASPQQAQQLHSKNDSSTEAAPSDHESAASMQQAEQPRGMVSELSSAAASSHHVSTADTHGHQVSQLSHEPSDHQQRQDEWPSLPQPTPPADVHHTSVPGRSAPVPVQMDSAALLKSEQQPPLPPITVANAEKAEAPCHAPDRGSENLPPAAKAASRLSHGRPLQPPHASQEPKVQRQPQHSIQEAKEEA
ncbi:hypothetical protein WJX74_001063 [Apatococcus lobatus]|uniref:Uncharacterized protein n=1 Tax=Apatococcus lobatus TaxID=904363 RepID=A0AAW1R280_9CHLO